MTDWANASLLRLQARPTPACALIPATTQMVDGWPAARGLARHGCCMVVALASRWPHLRHEDLAHGVRARGRQPHALLLHQHRREEGVGHAHQDAGTITWPGHRAHPGRGSSETTPHRRNLSESNRSSLQPQASSLFLSKARGHLQPPAANQQSSDGQSSKGGLGLC